MTAYVASFSFARTDILVTFNLLLWILLCNFIDMYELLQWQETHFCQTSIHKVLQRRQVQ
jgi:hypothetical protein